MDRSQTYVKASTVRGVSQLVGLVGLVAVLAGPVYAVVQATRAGGAVQVPVELSGGTGPLVGAQVALPDGVRLLPLPGGVRTMLSAGDSTVAEQLLASGDVAVLGLAVGLGAWLLRPVLASIAAGRPFGAGNSRRLAWLALVVAVAGSIGPLLPQFGALAVLDRLDLVGPDSAFVMGVTFSFLPIVVGGFLLLVLAEAFRQGERIDSDVEGLV
ncbi:DUF2975 domain-containing protein [Modestobacter sp. VKM Ac-2986]|uniref:DUF2975 domain-containing protein n=1 Tax=Modestobacter sp. VKM Ac-2986 TaxID=3004140 RepID=UPI0022AB9BF1|nr:DUF2975 domain-containing protein [Modestobacter sp. VKM Ac-2986]MCZ2830428.1 DUF2975 domain-containing protein [Modestobacter sp. VKM Ac-2986]